MSKRLPPISSLRALEAVARFLSFTKAAKQLHVTQSAVSHQIKLLEDLWEVKLFERTGRNFAVTRAGQEIADVTRDFFDRLSRTLDSLHAAPSREPLRVDTLQSFAVKWLVPRLGSFHQLHPEIDIWISTHEYLVQIDYDEVDIAIHLGDGHFPGLHSRLLFREEVFPVCTPEFLTRFGKPASPKGLLEYPLLLRLREPGHTNWKEWFEAAGIPDVRLKEGPRFPDTNMALQSAMDGRGIALARTAHVIEDLAAGRFVRLFDVPCPSNVAYYLVCSPGQQDRPNVVAFRDWILTEISSMKLTAKAIGALSL